MNVFDLPGPQFLAFYVVFSGLVAMAVWASLSASFRAATEPGPGLIADPYQIAWLRGGALEVGRLGIVSLASRGLIELPKPGVIVPETSRMPSGLHPVERAILVNCPRPQGSAGRVLRNTAVRNACRAMRDPLVGLGLAPSPGAKLGRAALCVGAALLVIGTGLAKLIIAVERGHSNVGFLILLMGIAAIAFLVLAVPRPRTPEGARMLADLRKLLEQRKKKIRPNSPSNEALLLASVYGAAGLAGAEELQRAYNRTVAPSSSNSCGSSSCSSSGCGGGGGCGGCGSS